MFSLADVVSSGVGRVAVSAVTHLLDGAVHPCGVSETLLTSLGSNSPAENHSDLVTNPSNQLPNECSDPDLLWSGPT